jgi:polysaccharide chain length determinant protein (PEP-CTERM system associated)
MLDSLSVPRRPFDFEDYVDIFRRNVRWLLAPAFAGLVIATVVAYMMDDTYVSSALIRVTPQQISPELVQNFTSQDVADRIAGMSQTILSHNALSSLITSYGLYKSDVKSEPLEDVIDKMHKAISIAPVGGSSMKGDKFLPVMQVRFSYPDRYTAQKVCADLVSRFMNMSTQYVVETQQQAHEFLNDEVDQAKRELSQIEQKLSDFRAQHAGRLPEEMQMNMQEMNALDNRLSALAEAASRNNERRMMLENELHIAKDRLATVHAPGNQKVLALDQQIQEQQTAIAEMKGRYTEDYPGLQAAKDRVAFLERERDAAVKQKSQKSGDTPVITREGLDGQESVDRIETQLKTNAMEEAQIRRDMQAVNSNVRKYQDRMEAVPASEKEYYDLLRDRDLAKQRYIDLETKRGKSSVSIDMEKRKQGETLELLDSASLPTSPTAPKRPVILPMGTFIGFVVGLVIVAIREVKDTSLKNLKDARLYTQLSILGSIPLLENDIVVQRRKQVMWVGWATATIAGLAIMAGSMAHYYLTKG